MSKNKNAASHSQKKEAVIEPQVEIKKEQKKEDKKTLAVARFFLYSAEFIIVLGVLVAAGFFWSQPQILSRELNELLENYKLQTVQETDQKLQNSVDNLMVQVNHLTEQTGYFMNLKADSSVVLGLVERMDNLEKKILKLATLSNEGALILSSAMMIKESAALGQPFEYEAEILKQLSQNQTEIATPVEEIYKLSSISFPSDKAMVDNFNLAYDKLIAEITPQEDNVNWKEKVARKVKQYVIIERTDKPEPVKGYDQIAALKRIKSLVDQQDFVGATNELALPENLPILENKHIANWVSQVQTKLKFYQDLSRVSSYSLVLMKADMLKNNHQITSDTEKTSANNIDNIEN